MCARPVSTVHLTRLSPLAQAGPVSRPNDFGAGMPGQVGGLRAPPAGTQAALLAAFSAQMGLNQVRLAG